MRSPPRRRPSRADTDRVTSPVARRIDDLGDRTSRRPLEDVLGVQCGHVDAAIGAQRQLVGPLHRMPEAVAASVDDDRDRAIGRPPEHVVGHVCGDEDVPGAVHDDAPREVEAMALAVAGHVNHLSNGRRRQRRAGSEQDGHRRDRRDQTRTGQTTSPHRRGLPYRVQCGLGRYRGRGSTVNEDRHRAGSRSRGRRAVGFLVRSGSVC